MKNRNLLSWFVMTIPKAADFLFISSAEVKYSIISNQKHKSSVTLIMMCLSHKIYSKVKTILDCIVHKYPVLCWFVWAPCCEIDLLFEYNVRMGTRVCSTHWKHNEKKFLSHSSILKSVLWNWVKHILLFYMGQWGYCRLTAVIKNWCHWHKLTLQYYCQSCHEKYE